MVFCLSCSYFSGYSSFLFLVYFWDIVLRWALYTTVLYIIQALFPSTFSPLGFLRVLMRPAGVLYIKVYYFSINLFETSLFFIVYDVHQHNPN